MQNKTAFAVTGGSCAAAQKPPNKPGKTTLFTIDASNTLISIVMDRVFTKSPLFVEGIAQRTPVVPYVGCAT
jgi:hypothetical protein